MTIPGQCIAVVSGKGGTGKTSFTAGVGAALARSGKRVLCVDCDVGLRNLDIAMGLTDEALMDFTDVAEERCPLEASVIEHHVVQGLFLLTAPPTRKRGRLTVTEGQMRVMLMKIRRKYDFCLLDAPSGLGTCFRLATCAADRCIVITTTDTTSLRDAQHTAMDLARFPEGQLHLVINRVRRKMLRNMHATLDDAIDAAGLPLLGIVPEDDALPLAFNRGELLLPGESTGAAMAYRNIAMRLQGIRVPLMRLRS